MIVKNRINFSKTRKFEDVCTIDIMIIHANSVNSSMIVEKLDTFLEVLNSVTRVI